MPTKVRSVGQFDRQEGVLLIEVGVVAALFAEPVEDLAVERWDLGPQLRHRGRDTDGHIGLRSTLNNLKFGQRPAPLHRVLSILPQCAPDRVAK